MTISKPGDITKFDETQVAILRNMLETLFNNAASIKNTDVVPTTSTLSPGEIAIYDNGSGTKRLYVTTGKGNLGYVALT